ncbi:ABA4-like family protein [Anabaena sp. PCC 7108]|uniref:ABA4-like family protein n=1 Tax=Anabaena sp. PCC 7108 TaxID=163908 RepID=UPI00034AF95D|nr:ABA4-like family protein [Anabaena sp. PCC 7108]
MNITDLFNVANLFVLPFWALMILLPNWKVTRKVMESYLPFVVLAGAYSYLFVVSITPENAAALSNPQLADIAKFFSDETAAATGWIHFLVMDLFVGRWIYWEGQKTGIWTIHSIALCLFAGPLGVLSHIFTYWITKAFSKGAEGVKLEEKAAAN